MMPGSRSTPPTAPPAALDALLAGTVGGTLRRAQWLDALDQVLRPHLPPALAAHARLANVRGDRLVFVVDAPVWHAKLRLASQGLIDAARSVGLEVTAVSVRTTTQPLQPHPSATHATPMSASTRARLAEALALLRPEAPGSAGGDGRKTGRRRT